MLNIVCDAIAQRAKELTGEQTLEFYLLFKQPGKDVKQGASKGTIQVIVSLLPTGDMFAVRSKTSMPWQDPTTTFRAVGVPREQLAVSLQRLLTPLKILAFKDGVAWTIV